MHSRTSLIATDHWREVNGASRATCTSYLPVKQARRAPSALAVRKPKMAAWPSRSQRGGRSSLVHADRSNSDGRW
jgi:hypothetical protein